MCIALVWLVLLCYSTLHAAAVVAPTPMVSIPAGPFIMGSTSAERAYGYRLDETLHGSITARQYRWFAHETRRQVTLPAYHIDRTPVTNTAYHRFIAHTGYRAPGVTEAAWQRYGLVHKYATVRTFLWRERHPPPGRAAHPVVLVSQRDAAAYCAWRGQQEGRRLRLPTEAEWEKAARGTDGRYFPWGNIFDPTRLNSYDMGPYDTVPVGRYPRGQSPYGVLDMAGQVFEWTATRSQSTPLTYIVKGGSWDDLPGVTRAAARHARPADLKHILIGFRCVAGPPTAD
jgi:formylglycine-generating enzyme required for sulfatase activity